MRIAVVGYGEVGRIFAEDLRADGHSVTAYDLVLSSPKGAPMRAHGDKHGVRLAESHALAVADAELVVCAVTADQTLSAARSCAPALAQDGFFLDLNSASPGLKIAAARAMQGGRGRYVEGAVMTSVLPLRLKVPVLIGGPDAAAIAPLLETLGFAASLANSVLGVASATKMCRSVVIKGLEMLLIESLTAARHYGVEPAVLTSLSETLPGIDWDAQASHSFDRVAKHGRRRSQEMREAAITVREVGFAPRSTLATAEGQAWMADLAERGIVTTGGSRDGGWRASADRILADLGARTRF